MPTWGNMLTKAQSSTVLESMPWLWLPPGLLITLVVLSINFLGDAYLMPSTRACSTDRKIM